MATDTFTASGLQLWTNGANWSSNSPPGSADDAFIGSGSAGIVGVGTTETVNSIGVSTNYAIDINSGAILTATLGTGSQSITGTIDIEDGSAFMVGSVVNNFGTIEIRSAGANTNFIFAPNSFVTLGGGGKIEMEGQNGRANFLDGMPGSTVINQDNDISGTGLIFGMDFVNNGIVETNNSFGAGTLSIYGSGGGGSFDNEGSMSIDPGGTMVIGVGNSQIANDGTIQLVGTANNAATLEVNGNLTIRSVGGTIRLQGNDLIDSLGGAASLTLDGGTLEGTGIVGDANLTVTVDSNTFVDTNSGLLVLNAGGGMTSSGTLEATAGGILTIECNLTNHGTVTASGSGDLVDISGTVVDSGGVVSIGPGGALVMEKSGSIAGVVTFAGANGYLQLDKSTAQISGNIVGAVSGDAIDLAFQAFAAGDHAVWKQGGTSGTLFLETANGTVLQTLTLFGQYTSSDFMAKSDGGGGTRIEVLRTEHATPNDFVGNGISDVLLQSGGTVVDWLMQNGQYQSGNVLTNGAIGWQVVGTGDFTGNGVSDVLLQNGGTVVDWIMKNGQYQSGNVLTNGAFGWQVVGTGDFTGTGTFDVLLQNGGTVVDWLMQNGAYQAGNVLTNGAAGWQVVGTGDFTGSGVSDVVLQNGGTVVDWLMQNGQYSSGNVLTTGAAGWTVVGTGDFTGTGTSDVLLQNGGTVVDWIMQNGKYVSGNVLTTAAAGWTVVGTGDYNGDGTSDVLLQNGGTVVDWIVKSGAVQSGNVITNGAAGFQVAKIRGGRHSLTLGPNMAPCSRRVPSVIGGPIGWRSLAPIAQEP